MHIFSFIGLIKLELVKRRRNGLAQTHTHTHTHSLSLSLSLFLLLLLSLQLEQARERERKRPFYGILDQTNNKSNTNGSDQIFHQLGQCERGVQHNNQ
jgi:hypothetical protein